MSPGVAVLTDRPPPIIRQGPSNQTLGVDSVALLKCQASGDPIPSISWLKDGVSLLGKDPRMSLQELGSLQIKNIKVNDLFHRLPHLFISLIYQTMYSPAPIINYSFPFFALSSQSSHHLH